MLELELSTENRFPSKTSPLTKGQRGDTTVIQRPPKSQVNINRQNSGH